jgi:hypothetical protein
MVVKLQKNIIYEGQHKKDKDKCDNIDLQVISYNDNNNNDNNNSIDIDNIDIDSIDSDNEIKSKILWRYLSIYLYQVQYTLGVSIYLSIYL